MNKIIKYGYIVIYILLLLVPVFTLKASTHVNPFITINTFTFFIFRVFALYGIILLFVQIVLGSQLRYFIHIFGGKIVKFHIIEGIIAYIVILLHPTFYSINAVLTGGVNLFLNGILLDFSSLFIDIGKLAITLLTLAVFAGILRNNKYINKYWHRIHILNYIVFALIIVHSLNLGQDVGYFPFVILYPIFIIVYSFMVIKKLIKSINLKSN